MVVVFENNTASSFDYTTLVVGQPGGFSMEAYLYAGANWLSYLIVRMWRQVNGIEVT